MKIELKKYLRWDYIYVFMAIVCPLVSSIVHVDGAGRLITFTLILTFALLLSNCRYRQIFKCIPVMIWSVWLSYACIQFGIMHNPTYDEHIMVYYYSMIAPFVIMTITIFNIHNNNFDTYSNVVLLGYYMFIILAYFTMSSELTDENRTNMEYIIDPNENSFAASICILIGMLKTVTRKISFAKLVLLSLFPIFVIIQMASRTGFLILLMMLAVFALFFFKNVKMDKKTKISLILLLCGVSLIAAKILYSSFIGQRLASTAEGSLAIDTGTVLDIMGDRGPFYYFGFLEFLKHPIWGIGLMNFGPNEVYGGCVCHTEIMVNLAETGIVGCILFWSFIVSLVITIIKTPGGSLPFGKIWLYLCLLIPFTISVFFWAYSRIYVFIFYGIIIGYHSYSQICRKFQS